MHKQAAAYRLADRRPCVSCSKILNEMRSCMHTSICTVTVVSFITKISLIRSAIEDNLSKLNHKLNLAWRTPG